MDTVPLALACLVLLAGCSMPGGGGDADPTETVTPVPVTDAESVDRVNTDAAADERPAPTPSDGGEFADLIDDHERTLANSTFTTVTVRMVERGDTLKYNATNRLYHGENETLFHDRVKEPMPVYFWSNGSLVVSKEGEGDDTEYRVEPELRSGVRPTEFTDLRRSLQYARTTAVEENETHYRVDATLTDEAAADPWQIDEFSNGSVSLVVADEDVIVSYRIVAVGRTDGERMRYVERFSLDRGTDPFERPEWVDRALANETESTPEERPTSEPAALATPGAPTF